MTIVNFILITAGVFFSMEGVTWLTHKFVMHGFLWNLHRDHHQVDPNRFWQKNDLFFVIFAVPSMTLFMASALLSKPALAAIGLGILFYGLAYFLVHEVLIHRRLKWFDKTDNWYFKALRKAHKVHHKHLDKHEGECFGMLLVPLKYYKYYLQR